jgi:hypothetical protein
MSDNLPWRAALLEGAAVLVAILVAFGIDAAWEVRQDRETEGAFLASLQLELAANRSLLSASLANIDSNIAATESYIVWVTTADPTRVHADSLRAMTQRMSPLRAQPLQRSAFEDLLSGGLQMIRSPELRRLVLEYGRALAIDDARQQSTQAWWDNHASSYDLREADLVGMNPDGWAGRTDLSVDIDPHAFIGNREFANILAARAYRAQDVRLARVDLLERLEELSDELERDRSAGGE